MVLSLRLALVVLVVSATPAMAQMVETNCLAWTEVEAVSPTGDWQQGSSINGASGSTYFTWTGDNHFSASQAGVHGLLTYTIQITRAGEYRFAIRNYHDDPDSTESNDCWLNVANNGWVKVYSEYVAVWQWMTKMDVGHGDTERPPVYQLGVGTHTVQISGRSNGFSIDRIHAYDATCASSTDYLNPYFSGGSTGNPPPASNPPPPNPAPPPSADPGGVPSGPSDAYTEILPRGCCRTATNGQGNQETPFTTDNIAACEAECNSQDTCWGFEWHAWDSQCEIHRGASGFDHGSDYDECMCFERNGGAPGANPPSNPTSPPSPPTAPPSNPTPPPPTPTPPPSNPTPPPSTPTPPPSNPSPPTSPTGGALFQEVLQPSRGCCRTADNSAGDEMTPFYSVNMAACAESCSSSQSCFGFEWHTWDNMCEMHSSAIGFAQTNGYALCMCFQRTSFGPAPTQPTPPPSNPTPPPVAPTPPPTNPTPPPSAPTPPPSPPTPPPSSPTPPPHSGYAYTEVLPRGCCRTETDGFGDEGSLIQVASIEECETSCSGVPNCFGFEWHSWDFICEHHTSMVGFHHGSGYDPCQCFLRTAAAPSPPTPPPTPPPSSPTPPPSTPTPPPSNPTPPPSTPTPPPSNPTPPPSTPTPPPSAPTPPPSPPTPPPSAPTSPPAGGLGNVYSEVTPRGCCRSAASTSGDEGTVVTQPSRTACQNSCTASANCFGYEWHSWDNGCEHHTSAAGFHHTSGYTPCECYFRGVIPGAPTVPPPTAPTTPPPVTGAHMVERDCFAYTEVEAIAATGDWAFGNTIEDRSGAEASGSGYFTWTGDNHFSASQAGRHGLLTYTIQITRAGEYRFAIRNYHDDPDSTESNDCWLNVANNGWVKVYSWYVNRWTFQTNMDLGHGDTLRPPVYQLGVGTHTVQISGRSHGYSIDRIHAFDTTCANQNDYENPYYTVALAHGDGGSDLGKVAGGQTLVGVAVIGGLVAMTVLTLAAHRARRAFRGEGMADLEWWSEANEIEQ